METYHLEEITEDQALVTGTRIQNAEAWAGDLTVDQYITRDQVTNNTPHFKHNIRIFQLVKNTGERVSSCEVLVRDATIISYVDGKAVRKACKNGSIGAVYTYKPYRNQSLAKIMMEKVIAKCKTDLIPGGFLTLHSEIGEYYRQFGFVSDEVPKVYVPLKQQKYALTGENIAVDEGSLQFLKYLEFNEVMEIYQADTDIQIDKQVVEDHMTRVEIDPRAEIIDWFHTKSKFVHGIFNPPLEVSNPTDFTEVSKLFQKTSPTHFGMQLVIKGSIAGFIIWTTDYSKEGNSIVVLAIHVRPQYDNNLRLKLLEYLNDYAVEQNKTIINPWCKIQLWASELPGIDAGNVGTVKTNSSLSALRMLDEQEQQKLEAGGVKWEINSNIPWF